MSLAAAGYGREVIAVFGRWNSSSLELYLKLQQHSLRKAAVAMAAVTMEMVDKRGQAGLRRDE